MISAKNYEHPFIDAILLQDEIIVSSGHSYTHLKIFYDFVMKGILPCSETDILGGKMSSELNSVFLSFGVDLNLILNSFLIKTEKGTFLDHFTRPKSSETKIESNNVFMNFLCKQELNDNSDKNEILDSDDNFDENLPLMDFLPLGNKKTSKRKCSNKRPKTYAEDSSDSDYKPYVKKSKSSIKQNALPKKVKNRDEYFS